MPAQAHVPIVLLVLAPEAGQTVGADPQVVIYTQRTLAGVDQVAYTLTPPPSTPSTDQRTHRLHPARPDLRRPVGPCATARARPRAAPARAAYRPDRDEPVLGDTVAFTVRPPPPRAASRPCQSPSGSRWPARPLLRHGGHADVAPW